MWMGCSHGSSLFQTLPPLVASVLLRNAYFARRETGRPRRYAYLVRVQARRRGVEWRHRATFSCACSGVMILGIYGGSKGEDGA